MALYKMSLLEILVNREECFL